MAEDKEATTTTSNQLELPDSGWHGRRRSISSIVRQDAGDAGVSSWDVELPAGSNRSRETKYSTAFSEEFPEFVSSWAAKVLLAP